MWSILNIILRGIISEKSKEILLEDSVGLISSNCLFFLHLCSLRRGGCDSGSCAGA